MKNRVVITGLGVVAPNGVGIADFTKAIKTGTSGIAFHQSLKDKGFSVNDYGCFSLESVDYPDFAHQLAQSIENGTNDLGIQFCGSGNGINMSANKHQAIRSALCWEVEIAELARLHNDANICTMPARFISLEKALTIIEKFINLNP